MNRAHIYRRAQLPLPPVVETSGLRWLAMSPGQLPCVSPGPSSRHGSHGVVVMELSRRVARSIRRKGLAYFEGATLSRGALLPPGPTRYEPWQPSPLPDALRERHGEAGLEAGMRRRLRAAWQEEAYGTRAVDGSAWLAVLPAGRLVVYCWRD